VPQWCLTAPCVAPPEEDLNAFDVGAPPGVDDEPALDDEAVFAVKPPVGADLPVDRVDDFEVVTVPAPEPAVLLPVGPAFAEFRTSCRLPVSYDQCLVDVVPDVPDVPDVAGAAAASGAVATASATPIPAEANPIARSGRTDTAIPSLPPRQISQRRNDFSAVAQNGDV